MSWLLMRISPMTAPAASSSRKDGMGPFPSFLGGRPDRNGEGQDEAGKPPRLPESPRLLQGAGSCRCCRSGCD